MGSWSRLFHVLCLVAQSCLTLGDPMDYNPPGASVHGDSPGRNTGVGYHALLQGNFPAQGSNPGLLHCRWILYCLCHHVSPTQFRWSQFCWPHPKHHSQVVDTSIKSTLWFLCLFTCCSISEKGFLPSFFKRPNPSQSSDLRRDFQRPSLTILNILHHCTVSLLARNTI